MGGGRKKAWYCYWCVVAQRPKVNLNFNFWWKLSSFIWSPIKLYSHCIANYWTVRSQNIEIIYIWTQMSKQGLNLHFKPFTVHHYHHEYDLYTNLQILFFRQQELKRSSYITIIILSFHPFLELAWLFQAHYNLHVLTF